MQAAISIIIVGMGASLGREAAPKQTGALTASVLGQWVGLSNSQRRLLCACGAGAGIAAVYNVPLGGAIFALEVLLGTISLSLVPPALVTALVATSVSWLLLPNEPTYQIPSYHVSFDQIVWSVIFGPIAGFVSVVYVRLISWADALKPTKRMSIFAPVIVFGVLGVLAIFYPELLGNGKDVVQRAFTGSIGLSLLLAILVLKPIVTSACLACGAPGGLFTPTLTLGALLGATMGQLWVDVWPGSPVGSFAVIGACAIIAASMQGPISAVVLTLELTHRLDTLMVPTVLATTIAVVVARRLEARSIYSGRIHERREAALRWPSAVSSAARLVELQRLLLKTRRHSVMVVDQTGVILGEATAHRINNAPPDALPLETATAADFHRAARARSLPLHRQWRKPLAKSRIPFRSGNEPSLGIQMSASFLLALGGRRG